MKIAVVSAHFPPDFVSGGTLVPQRLARGLFERGHQVAVFAGHLGTERAPLSEWEEPDEIGLPVHWISVRSFIGWSDRQNYQNPAVNAAFARWLDAFDPDVVHFHALQALGAGVVAVAADKRIPTVVTLHDSWWWCGRQFLVTKEYRPCSVAVDCGNCPCEVDRGFLDGRNAYLRGVLERVDVVCAVSESMRRVAMANGVDPQRVVVDENGVPEPAIGTTRPHTEESGVVRFLYAGGPQELKGVHVLADAARLLTDTEGWTLACYGCSEWLADHAPDLGAPLVRAPASYDPDDVASVLEGSDVLVVPSLRESFSILTREVLGQGIPVLTTDCLGPEEVVEHGRNGLIVPAADAHALAEGMRRLVTEPGLLDRLRAGCTAVPLRSPRDQLDGEEARYRALIESRDASAYVRERRRRISRVLYIVGIDGSPLRYRAHLPAEALRTLGVHTDVYHYRHPAIGPLAEAADAIVIYRVPSTRQIASLIAGARRRAVPVLYDIDDLVFDPGLASEVSALATLTRREVDLWLSGVRRYGATLALCDGFIGSTPMLCRHAEATVGIPSFLFENGVGMVLGRLSDRAYEDERTGGPVRIGYLSGTKTHQRDWTHIEPAVAEVLDARDDVELWLIGLVAPTKRLREVEHRIRRYGFSDWTALPALLRQLDVNLAPLELGGRFNEAKSAIKWLEAALVGTPTIASPTEPFTMTIEPGVNGLLAESTAQWRAALDAMVNDEAMRARLGERARRDALLNYAPALQGRRYLAILESVVSRAVPSMNSSSFDDEPPMVVELDPYGTVPDRDAIVAPRLVVDGRRRLGSTRR